MPEIEIKIFNANGKLLEQINPKELDDLFFYHEMFDELRTFDMTPQLNELIENDLTENREAYSLFCTYVKFGAVQQEQTDFSVTIRNLTKLRSC